MKTISAAASIVLLLGIISFADENSLTFDHRADFDTPTIIEPQNPEVANSSRHQLEQMIQEANTAPDAVQAPNVYNNNSENISTNAEIQRSEIINENIQTAPQTVNE